MRSKTIVMILSVLVLAAFALGCTGNDSLKGSARPVEAVWINPAVKADVVSIPIEAVDKNTNVHFKVNTGASEVAVMAYRLGDELFIRSSVCPPCGSMGFALEGNILVCDACATRFDASTGMGVGGACIAYPKESIPYTVLDGNLTMSLSDIMTAYQETLEPN